MGLANFVAVALAVPMALELFRRRPVKAPRGLGLWLLFLLWVVTGVFVLQVNAPDTVPGASGSRYFTFAYRLLWYLAATVVLLYVGNVRTDLAKAKIVRAGGCMFLVVVAGGLLGTFAPHFEFPSLLELALPRGATSGNFVKGLVHPSAAQVQTFLGYDQGRPSAPFAFTNDWGLNYAVFLPFFVLVVFKDASRRLRAVGVCVLFLSLVPVVASLNRGLWLALTVAAAYLAIRFAFMGKLMPLTALLVTMALGAGIILASPLSTLVADRFEHPDSNSGRTNLGTQTTISTLEGSPFIGYGSTRDPASNWTSIAAGATATCPRCSPPPLGTQGQLWLVMFAEGFGGLLLYLAFFVYVLLRHVRLRDPYAVGGVVVLLMHLLTLPFYSAVNTALYGIMMGVGLVWRSRQDCPTHMPSESIMAAP